MPSLRIGHRIAPLAALILACASSCDTPTEPSPAAPSLVTSTVKVNVDSLTADGVSTATVTVRLRDASNAPLTASGGQVAVSASAGAMSAVTDQRNGTYTATFTAPTTSGQATISVTLNGKALKNQRTVTLVAGPSLANSTVTASVDSLTADGASTATVTVRLRDANNDTLTHGGEEVVVFATAGRMGGVTDHGDGTYTATFTAPTFTGQDTISATLNGNALKKRSTITLVAGPPLLSKSHFGIGDTLLYGDGKSSTYVYLDLYDQYSNQILTAPGPIVFATTKGSISAVTADLYGDFLATLTSTAGDATASVTAKVNGQPLPFTVTSHFATHRLWVPRPACCQSGQYGFVTGAVSGIIYATGGYNFAVDGDQILVADVQAYDPAANSWTAKAAMLFPRAGHAVAGLNGALYVVGGYTDSAITNTVMKYDPASNTWSTAAPMPTARSGLAVGVVAGILYAVGGYDGSGDLDVVEAYDPATDSWTTRASLPTRRSGLAAGVVNGVLYAVGGDANPSSAIYAYDPATNSWTSKAFMPDGGSGLSAGALGAKLYTLAGSGYEDFALYDPASNSWSIQPSVPQPSASSSVVNGSLYSLSQSAGGMFMYVP